MAKPTKTRPAPEPVSLSALARMAGLERYEVSTLLVEWGVPVTYRLGAYTVAPEYVGPLREQFKAFSAKKDDRNKILSDQMVALTAAG